MVSLRRKWMVTDGLPLDVTVNRADFPYERGYVYGDSISEGAKYYVADNTGRGTSDSSCFSCSTVCVETGRIS